MAEDLEEFETTTDAPLEYTKIFDVSTLKNLKKTSQSFLGVNGFRLSEPDFEEMTSDQFVEYIKEVPGKKSTDRLKSKIYKHIINLSKRGIYSEAKKKKSKRSGSEPEESYRPATKKNLYLDKPTSHGGWPEGPSKSYTSDKPVNVQIYDWLESMGLIKKL